MAIAYQLSEEDRALIAHFHSACRKRGMDGVYSLEPVDRGVLAVADMVRRQTALRIFAELDIKGDVAAKGFFGSNRRTVPATEPELLKLLESVFRG